MPDPSVSVIIPACNCEQTISQTLRAVMGQDYGAPAEIIVIDDGSSDRTPEIVKGFETVSYFYQQNAGPAAARNHGARIAKTDVIVFTDSDCIPRRDWLKELVGNFCDPQVGAVAGSYGIANSESLLARCICREIRFRHEKRMTETVRVFGSYNVAIRKSVFDDVGGFDESYRHASGEDNDLSYKINKAGHRIHFDRDAIVDHFHPAQLTRYLREQYRHGFWRVKMYLSHPGMCAGDDYTFWKDMVEIPLAAAAVAAFLLAFLGLVYAAAGMGFLLALLVLELIFSIIMISPVFEAFFFSGVMALRALARMMGFVLGLICSFSGIFQKSASP